MMTVPQHHQTRPAQRAAQAPWNGARNAYGNPVIKGVTELQSAAAIQDARAKGSLYGDVPTSRQLIDQEQQRAAANKMKVAAAFAAGYEKYRRGQGAGAGQAAMPPAPWDVAADPAQKRRANLIAGGAQPMEADKIIADEAKLAATTPAQAPTVATKVSATTGGAPAPQAPAPIGIGADANLTTTALSTPASAAPIMSTINDGGTVTPIKDWIKQNKDRQAAAPAAAPAPAAVAAAPAAAPSVFDPAAVDAMIAKSDGTVALQNVKNKIGNAKVADMEAKSQAWHALDAADKPLRDQQNANIDATFGQTTKMLVKGQQNEDISAKPMPMVEIGRAHV